MKIVPYLFIYPIFVIMSITFTLLGVILSPVIALFCDKDGNLPRFLKYFQTFDDTLNALGDGYVNHVKWLVRNPAYGFDKYVFGLKWDVSEWVIHRCEITPERDLFFATGRGFNFYYQGRLGTYKLGWKAWGNYSRFDMRWLDVPWSGDYLPICFSANPFRQKD